MNLISAINTNDLDPSTVDYLNNNFIDLNTFSVKDLVNNGINEDECIKILQKIHKNYRLAERIFFSAMNESGNQDILIKFNLSDIEIKSDSKVNQRPGYHWVDDKRVKDGGYWRKNPPKMQQSQLNVNKSAIAATAAGIASAAIIGSGITAAAIAANSGSNNKESKNKETQEPLSELVKRKVKEADRPGLKELRQKVKGVGEATDREYEQLKAKKKEAQEQSITLKSAEQVEPEPGLEIDESLLEVNSEQEARIREILINKMVGSIDKGINSIKQVHSLAGLPQFDIKIINNEQDVGSYGGMQAVSRVFPGTNQKMIRFAGMELNLGAMQGALVRRVPMTEVENTVHATTIHEIGHILDLTGIGAPGRFATASVDDRGNDIPNTANAEVAGLVSAIERSRGIAQIRESMNNSPNPQLREYGEYLLSTRETFARAYTQYIATKTNDARLLNYLQTPSNNISGRAYGSSHWESEEFNSTILPEFDRIFQAKGWLR